MQSPRHRVWLVAAWAALAVQAVSQASFGDCGRACCATGIDRIARGPADRCPHCEAAEDGCPVEPLEQPCDCRLDARRGDPMASGRNAPPAFDPAACSGLPTSATTAPPRTLGVGRDYLAAFLSVPIRPPRILFGVWRN